MTSTARSAAATSQKGEHESICLDCMNTQCRLCEVHKYCPECNHKSCSDCEGQHTAQCKGKPSVDISAQGGIAEAEVVQAHRMCDSDSGNEDANICPVCSTTEDMAYAIMSPICHDCLNSECGKCRDHKACPTCGYSTCATCWEGHTSRCGGGWRSVRNDAEVQAAAQAV